MATASSTMDLTSHADNSPAAPQVQQGKEETQPEGAATPRWIDIGVTSLNKQIGL